MTMNRAQRIYDEGRRQGLADARGVLNTVASGSVQPVWHRYPVTSIPVNITEKKLWLTGYTSGVQEGIDDDIHG